VFTLRRKVDGTRLADAKCELPDPMDNLEDFFANAAKRLFDDFMDRAT
jgi:hypothetical protein